MSIGPILPADLARTLPLPLAQLHRRAKTAKTAIERHDAAFHAFEVLVKLLGVTLLLGARSSVEGRRIVAGLPWKSRPSLEDWCRYVRSLLTPDERGSSDSWRQLWIEGTALDRCPHIAHLDDRLAEILQASHEGEKAHLDRLFQRLVEYRRRIMCRDASERRSASFHDDMATVLHRGMEELLTLGPVLGDRHLVYVERIERDPHGTSWIELLALHGENPKRLRSLECTPDEAHPGIAQVHLVRERREGGLEWLGSQEPLVTFDPRTVEFFFFHRVHEHDHAEFLCYGTGRTTHRVGAYADWSEVLEPSLRELPTPPPPSTSSLPFAPTAESPKEIGGYPLLSRLGQGAMGTVYRAWQASLGREVALKVLGRYGEAEAEARFTREIHALARVDHPHLVKIFASGAEGPHWFYAMELVDGVDLARVWEKLAHRRPERLTARDWSAAFESAYEEERSREHRRVVAGEEQGPREAPPRPVSRSVGRTEDHAHYVVREMRPLIQAVDRLHEAGVVHRDIKPANIMIAMGTQNLVLMDLGLAQLKDDVEGRLTRTRQVVGTLRYASPEQLTARDVDRRSDVYSVGVVLWEMITMRPMSYGKPLEELGLEVIGHVVTDEPERPGRHYRGLSRDLESIILTCLRKDPGERYPTAGELDKDLARWQNSEPVVAHPPTIRYLLRKAVARHRLGFASAATLLVVALALTFLAFSEINAANTELREERRQTAAVSDAMTTRALLPLLQELGPDLEARRKVDLWLERSENVLSRRASYGEPPWNFRLVDDDEIREMLDRFSWIEERHPVVARLQRNIEDLERRSLLECSEAWAEALASIRGLEVYAGLDMVPQLGLRPLGRDPRSGLFEFACAMSGEDPRRGMNGEWIVEPETAIVFVLIPGGTYWMGSKEDVPRRAENEPAHLVSLPAFFLSKYELTQAVWERTFGENPSRYPPGSVRQGVVVSGIHPVERVSWYDGQVVSRWLGLRLPTEEEWEYACRATRTTLFHWGDEEGCLRGRENLADESYRKLAREAARPSVPWSDGHAIHAPVGSYEPNAFGLYDMHGNVSEWVQGRFRRYYGLEAFAKEVGNLDALERERVARGGNCTFRGDPYARAATRQPAMPALANFTIGLRLARSVVPSSEIPPEPVDEREPVRQPSSFAR